MQSFESYLFENVDRRRAADVGFMCELYRALCNTAWVPVDMPLADRKKLFWSCTWRTAGAIVADIRNHYFDCNENFLDYYCGGDEGVVSPQVREFCSQFGWEAVPWTDLAEDNSDE